MSSPFLLPPTHSFSTDAIGTSHGSTFSTAHLLHGSHHLLACTISPPTLCHSKQVCLIARPSPQKASTAHPPTRLRWLYGFSHTRSTHTRWPMVIRLHPRTAGSSCSNKEVSCSVGYALMTRTATSCHPHHSGKPSCNPTRHTLLAGCPPCFSTH